MKFLALNADITSPHVDPVCSRRLAHANVKKGHPTKKSGYVTDISVSSVKQLQIGLDMPRIMRIASFLAVLTSMTLNDLGPPK